GRPVESPPVTDAPRARLPWLLVAASALLAVLLAYTLFGGYLPAKRRVARLQRELRDVYAREADLQTKVAQNEHRYGLRERQRHGAGPAGVQGELQVLLHHGHLEPGVGRHLAQDEWPAVLHHRRGHH